MVNKNYDKGRRKEYRIMKAFKDKGFITFRSAGSHSPIDVVGIDVENKRITFIQAKPDSMSENEKNKLKTANIGLNGLYNAQFDVW